MSLFLPPLLMIVEIIQVWQAAPNSLWAWVQTAFGLILVLNFMLKAKSGEPPSLDLRISSLQLYFGVGIADVVVAGSHFLISTIWKNIPIQSIWITIGLGMVIILLSGVGLLLLRKKISKE